jgi:hypothetical protein
VRLILQVPISTVARDFGWRAGMRSFIIACIAAVVIAAIGAIGLNFIQEPVNVAFSTEAVRI